MRKPTVGPGWTTRSARSNAPSSLHSVRGTSWKLTRAGTWPRSTGKSGGEKQRPTRSRRLCVGDGGPQTSSVTSSSHSGAKKRSPSRWSRCRCVRSRRMWRVPRFVSSSPRPLIPVPASRTRTLPSSSATSTHDVLPPYRTVLGPGVGTEPRQPQIVTRTPASLLAPEDGDDADELVGVGEERERGQGDLSLDAVDADDAEATVGRPAVLERDLRGSTLVAGGIGLERTRLERRHPAVEQNLARFGERPADDLRHRVVVEDEDTALVCDQHRRGEAGGELSGEDERQVLWPGDRHAAEPTPTDHPLGGGQVTLSGRSIPRGLRPRLRARDRAPISDARRTVAPRRLRRCSRRGQLEHLHEQADRAAARLHGRR